jgi:hypothetical protein
MGDDPPSRTGPMHRAPLPTLSDLIDAAEKCLGLAVMVYGKGWLPGAAKQAELGWLVHREADPFEHP